jgi:DNA-binding MarR family transcriptional regulator
MLPQGDLVLDFIETMESLKLYRRSIFRCVAPIRGNAMRLLMFLHYHAPRDCPGIQPSELGEMLRLTRPTITSLVNDLEGQGLVERISDDEDRRAVYVRPTSQGVELVHEARAEFSRGISEMMEYLGEADGHELMRILRRVRQFLQDKENEQERNQALCGN